MTPTILDVVHITSELMVTFSTLFILIMLGTLGYSKLFNINVIRDESFELGKWFKGFLWVWAICLLIMAVTYHGQELSLFRLY